MELRVHDIDNNLFAFEARAFPRDPINFPRNIPKINGVFQCMTCIGQIALTP